MQCLGVKGRRGFFPWWRGTGKVLTKWQHLQRAVRKPRVSTNQKQAGEDMARGRHSRSKTQEAGQLLLFVGGSLVPCSPRGGGGLRGKGREQGGGASLQKEGLKGTTYTSF